MCVNIHVSPFEVGVVLRNFGDVYVHCNLPDHCYAIGHRGAQPFWA